MGRGEGPLVARCGPAPARRHAAAAFDAEHPLYIMYTWGTTAKPKGILHTSGGYLTHVSATHRLIFDVKPETDVLWTAADIGWVTGTVTSSTGPSPTARPLSCTRARRTRRDATAGGGSSRGTR